MNKRLLSLVVLALVPAAMLGGQIATSGAAGKSVTLKDIRFSPASLRVAKGSTVTFRWNDGGTAHNVTSKGSTHFKSSSTKQKGTYVVRFRKAGTYRYVCTIHPGMSGRITVR